ncbi:MAG: biopolymer transporter ExbD [Kofleriaceae bacterium]|nr:biopolymer transporter ExbD [Kofleriaceae bacterium]
MAAGKLPDAGGGDEEGGGDSIFAEINITPLTDVFLVMVIIFMVSALAVQAERNNEKKQVTDQQVKEEAEKKSGIKINLPSGAAQDIDPSKASLVLMIPIDGDVNVGGKAMKDAELDALFRAAFAKDKMTQVVLKADKGVSHGKVVNLMERAKQVGLTRLAIGTSGGAN